MRLAQLISASCLLFVSINLYSRPEMEPAGKQSGIITSILKNEKNSANRREIVTVIDEIDRIYGSLYDDLKKKKKLVVFFDPAHGKLPNGAWQGGSITGRLSCTNIPEEYYSIAISRELYKLLINNPFIHVRSTDDYMDVLRGTSVSYKNIPFPKTVKLAREAGSFIILSEHLNNVSMFHKADGRVNLPGLHITRNRFGHRILRYVSKTYEGFLTLYNKLDTSGFSRLYALKLKNRLSTMGFKPNIWQKGAVGDDRFSYFFDFPISIIFESGFTSNPHEEEKLRDPHYIKKLVKAQYETLIENIRDTFGVDISGNEPVRIMKDVYNRLELIKLARIAVDYLKRGDTDGSLFTINLMLRRYGKTGYRHYIYYFIHIKNSLVRAERFYQLGKRYSGLAQKYRKKKNWKQWRRFRNLSRIYYKRAKNYTSRPVFLAYRIKYSEVLSQRHRRISHRRYSPRRGKTVRKETRVIARRKAARWTPVILPIDAGQSLEDALIQALSPDKKNLEQLLKSLRNTKITRWVKRPYYSRKRKRWVTKWVKRTRRVYFRKGIYIVKLDRKLRVIKAKRVDSVRLLSKEYQNQQYLNNSYFANDRMIKTL